MALTETKVIVDRIRSGFNPNYYRYLYQQMVYQLGQEKTTLYSESCDGYDAWGDGIKYFKSIDIDQLTLGASRRPQNTTYIMQSRVMGSQMRPTFPQVDPLTREVRAEYCMNRDKQTYGLGEWFPEMVSAYNHADSLGYSGTQIGQQTDPLDKLKTVCLQTLPPTQIVFDPMVYHPSQSSWVALIHYVTPADVIAAGYSTDKKAVKDSCIEGFESINGQKWDIARLIEYFDLGTGKREPTYAMFMGALHSTEARHPGYRPESLVMKTSNKRENIPVAFMVNFVCPGMTRPVGRVHLQFQSAKMINLLEEYMFRELSTNYTPDLIDVDAINPEDWQRHITGEPMSYMRLNRGFDKQVWQRPPNKSMDRSILEIMGYYQRMSTEDSGLSEIDRGVGPDTVRSARELNLIDSRSQMNQAWMPRETNRYGQRLYSRIIQAAAYEDDKPILIDYQGRNLPINFNNEAYPNLTLENFCTEPSTVLIDQSALTSDDDLVKKNQQLQFIDRLFANGLVGPPPLVDPTWAVEQYLRAGGRDDAKMAMGQSGARASSTGLDPAMLQAALTGQGSTRPLGA